MTTPKTLADMTQQERAECIGMWCVELPNRPISTGGIDGVLIGYDSNEALVITPRGVLIYPQIDLVQILVDLPRVWSPDGTPPKGRWEKTRILNAEEAGHEPRTYRQWIGEWEPADE